MDTRETDRFLHRLYEQGDKFEVLYLDNDGDVRRGTRTHEEGSHAFLDEVGRAETAGYNVYVSAMPLGIQKTNLFDRIWIDQDDVEGPWPFGADPAFDGPSWPEPSTLVKTSDGVGGYRWQAIWKLSVALDASEAKSMMKSLAGKIGADLGVHDSRRVLRLAGVMNAKRGSQARLMSTSEGTVSKEAFALPKAAALTKYLQADVQNPNHVLGEWLEGVQDGDRNRKAYMAARHLKNAAVAWNDAAAILKLGAQRCEPMFDDSELEHALNSAYHREG